MTEIGKLATVVFDTETGEPTVANEYVKSDWHDISSDYLDDIRLVSIWSFEAALYALQHPTSSNIVRALKMISMSGDIECNWDGETLILPLIDPPNGWEDNLYA